MYVRLASAEASHVDRALPTSRILERDHACDACTAEELLSPRSPPMEDLRGVGTGRLSGRIHGSRHIPQWIDGTASLPAESSPLKKWTSEAIGFGPCLLQGHGSLPRSHCCSNSAGVR